jgi:signal transduction histidine kinase
MPPQTPVSILLIDNDEHDYRVVNRFVKRMREPEFKVEWCPSFDVAKELIAQYSHDMYLVDYRLDDDHTGFELLKIAEPDKRPEPFILLTETNDRSIERQALKLGASDCLARNSLDTELLLNSFNYALGRKEAEAQRFQHLIELNQAKDEFISVASHQLRTPATGVKQYIGMLLEGMFGELTAAQKQILEKAYDSNERQLKIVSDLLKVARVDAGKVILKETEVDMNTLVADVVGEESEITRERGQTVEFTPASVPATAWADRDTIRMVFENLIDNASKYSEQGQIIRVVVRVRKRSVTVKVTDQGVGIKEEDIGRLFEKFSRIHNPLSTQAGGSGLGLYWAKKIVDLHNGTIEVESRPGSGTTFFVHLPRLLL